MWISVAILELTYAANAAIIQITVLILELIHATNVPTPPTGREERLIRSKLAGLRGPLLLVTRRRIFQVSTLSSLFVGEMLIWPRETLAWRVAKEHGGFAA